MKDLKKYISAFCAVVIAVAGVVCGVSADDIDYDAKIKKLEEKTEQLRQKNLERENAIDSYINDVNKQDNLKSQIEEAIKGVREEIAVQQELVSAKQSDIDQKISSLNALQSKIDEAQAEIVEHKREIASLDSENKRNIEIFGQIVKTMYMTEDYSTVEILAGSADFFDLLVRSEIMTNVGNQERKFMNDLKIAIKNQTAEIEKLNAETADLEIRKSKASEERAVLEGNLNSLQLTKETYQAELQEKQQKLYAYAANIASLRNEISNIRTLVSANQKEMDDINAEVAAMIREKQKAAEQSGESVSYSSDGFLWPLESGYHLITTYFGWDAWRNGKHYGIDIGDAGIGGSNIYAAQSGTVITAFNDGGGHGGYGNYVVIDHGGGLSTLYAHGATGGIVVKPGDKVEKGQLISHVGDTGWATGKHLHFEVRINGTAVNPFNYKYENSAYF